MTTLDFQSLLQGFFTDRLLRQKRASLNTIACYRDTFRLLLKFAMIHLKIPSTSIKLEQLDATFLGSFLDDLEKHRNNSTRTRNVRLAAIHSFFRYVSQCDPCYILLCRQVLAIPNKRYESRPIEFLNLLETKELLQSPNQSTWVGRRDQALLMVAIQTGLRVSELIALQRQHVQLGKGAHLVCLGKGRKQRCTPLRKDVVTVLAHWLQECSSSPNAVVFPTRQGAPLSRDAIEKLLEKYIQIAQTRCATIKQKRITPHTLRHTAAMQLLHSGVDRSVIALWLGHESMETTQIYLHADMTMKEQALARTNSTGIKPARFQANDNLMAFLEGL